MISTIRTVITLSRGYYLRAALVVLLHLSSSLLDLALVATSVPLVAELSGVTMSSPLVDSLVNQVANISDSPSVRLQSLILLMSVILVIRMGIKAAAISLETVLKNRISISVSTRGFLSSLRLKEAFSDVIDTSSRITELQNLRNSNDLVVEPFLRILTEFATIVLIVVYLFVLAPLPTLAGVSFLSGLAFVQQQILGQMNQRYAVTAHSSNLQSMSLLRSAFNLLPEIILYRRQHDFQQEFSRVSTPGIKSRNHSHTLQALTPVVFEFFGLSLALLILFASLSVVDDPKNLMPILSGFMFGLFRIIPSLASLQNSINRIRYGSAQISSVLSELLLKDSGGIHEQTPRSQRLSSLCLSQVEFSYGENSPIILERVSLSLERPGLVGVIGPSGSGKSTLAKLIAGLISPKSGEVRLFDVNGYQGLHNDFRLAYVPQSVSLINGGLAENVALAFDKSVIDFDRVNQCLSQVGLEYLVPRFANLENCSLGIDADILSGGEKQRLALARAIYQEADLLVLDEPTNSLDSENQASINELLLTLSQQVLCILITHQPESVLSFTRIIEIREQNIVEH